MEFVDDLGDAVSTGDSGDLICTGLLNGDMPLVRYRIGDRGAEAPQTSCSCARTLPAVARIDGRSDDVLYTTDGRAVGRLDPVFKGHLPIREAQIIQHSLKQIRVRFVPAADFTPASLSELSERLRARLGPVEIVTEALDAIPRTDRGKFRAVVCQLSREDRERVRAGRGTPAGVA